MILKEKSGRYFFKKKKRAVLAVISKSLNFFYKKRCEAKLSFNVLNKFAKFNTIPLFFYNKDNKNLKLLILKHFYNLRVYYKLKIKI
jgi:hypothetical protein